MASEAMTAKSVKEPAVSTAMGQLDKMIAELDAATARLCERINPVTRQEPENAAVGKSADAPSSVPLVAELDGYRVRLNGIRYRVNGALDRIEL